MILFYSMNSYTVLLDVQSDTSAAHELLEVSADGYVTLIWHPS